MANLVQRLSIFTSKGDYKKGKLIWVIAHNPTPIKTKKKSNKKEENIKLKIAHVFPSIIWFLWIILSDLNAVKKEINPAITTTNEKLRS